MSIDWLEPLSHGGFPIESFKVYVDNSVFSTLDPAENNVVLTGLTLGTTYKVQVSSVNQVGESPLSDALTILFANIPSMPATVSLTATKTSITVNWTAPASSNGDVV